VKLLRNRMAVGVLVLLAVAVVAYQFWPMLRPRFVRSSPPPPHAAPAATPSAPAKPVPPAAGTNALSQVSTSSLDIVVLEVNSARWAEAPRNDPFKVRFYVGPQSTNSRPAREFMTLNAIWQQGNDSPLAVINNHVFNEGDVILVKDGKVMLEYTVSDIESDRVWVDGPNGREPLRFKLPTAAGPGDTAEFTLEKEVRVTPKSGP
jgi:hypothetical protein